jgi:uncharacterized protein
MTVLFNSQTISLTAALIAGIVGSTHCLAMCGGFAGALGMRARANGKNAAAAFSQALATQLGRISSYAIAGALAGGVGAAIDALMELVRVAQALRVISGLLLIAIAIRVAFAWNLLASIERFGARLWSHLAPLTLRATRTEQIGVSFLLGAAWGWLPCGLVYSILLYAAFSGKAAQGAAIMSAFGLGTLPAMLGSGVFAGQVARLCKTRTTRWIAAGVLASFGAISIIAVFPTVHLH